MDNELLAERLLQLGYLVRENVVKGRSLGDARAIEHIGGDTIFGVDRRVEPLIVSALGGFPSEMLPLVVVCEGLGTDGRCIIGAEGQEPRFRVLIDPIDGTRSLMYDKRSAWFLAAVAPDRGEATTLGDSVAAVMVELPTTKQGFADAYWASAGGPAKGSRRNLFTGREDDLRMVPSGSTTLRHGFAQVSSFFPGTKRLAADLMETIAKATLGTLSISEASIFDDQYISTGGQLVEIMTGKDRFCCDLRPIFYQILHKNGDCNVDGLCCHPYDLAGLSIARAAGVILTDGFGAELNAPFDVHTGMHWCGYANEELRRQIEPSIQEWLQKALDEGALLGAS
jgi:fructose-1,6-bisphosphatase/inositol monophosphatase family enzyme